MENSNDYSGLPDVIKELMGSPQIADILKSMVPAQQQPLSTEKQENGGISIPPDIMDKLPGVISALRDAGIGAPASENAASQQPDINDIASKIPQAMSALSGFKSKSTDNSSKNRKALLTALKPYMNDKKRSAIDTMLNVDSMTEILQIMMGGEK